MSDEIRIERAPLLDIQREFMPASPDHVFSAGLVTVRAANYGTSLEYLDRLFTVLERDMLQCEPPYEVKRHDVEVVLYGGDRYAGTFGLRFWLERGHIVPEDYQTRTTSEITR